MGLGFGGEKKCVHVGGKVKRSSSVLSLKLRDGYVKNSVAVEAVQCAFKPHTPSWEYDWCFRLSFSLPSATFERNWTMGVLLVIFFVTA